MPENGNNSNPQGATAASVRFPGEDAGHSLAAMAQRDLDAALQLLADRAQYITGATGAAIALRRSGMHDMMCRASTGSNAPELGALLSTEFGLSGESVRTRRTLRCDDAERDARVNREVCRRLGIASVVVMPVVNDDEVLGVFELFSGKANAFGERDLSAMQRLSQMVETAVRLAHATESLPERLKDQQSSSAESVAADVGEEILDVSIFDPAVAEPAVESAPAQAVAPAPPAEKVAEVASVSQSTAPAPASIVTPALTATPITSSPNVATSIAPAVVSTPTTPAAETVVPAAPKVEAASQAEVAPPKKKLFWSAAMDIGQTGKPAQVDQSLVPPVMRGLRKCEVCGFPVSAGRALCVECEERRWRGQLRRPLPTGALPAADGKALQESVQPSAMGVPVPHKMAEEPLAPGGAGSSPELVLSAGLASPPSWVSTHKVTVGILLAIVGSIAVVALFR